VVDLNLLRLESAEGRPWAELLRRLGWTDARGRLTDLGWAVSDPLREYRFWIDRGRRLHGERSHSRLARSHYAGKRLLEVGSGFGCNLFPLVGLPGEFVGVEPVEVYRQLTPILAAREELSPPPVVEGRGEALPFPDGSFDLVMSFSAYQYMDVRAALVEMSRVVRPGGELQLLGPMLDGLLREAVHRFGDSRSLREPLHLVRTLLNTAAYVGIGRRLHVPAGAGFTSSPVHPPARVLRTWLEEAGLVVTEELRLDTVGDSALLALKPER
jgi:SAM-dependent methyltransferase